MNTVKIGWGRREISVNEPVSLPGQMYMRISTGIHDPTYATALCVDGGIGQDAVIFCTCDHVEFFDGIVEDVLSAVSIQEPDIPIDNIILGCTHTHASGEIRQTPPTAPDGTPIYPGNTYRQFFTRMCVEAIAEAWNSRQAGGIAYGYGYAVVGHSRRVVYLEDVYQNKGKANAAAVNGKGVMYGNTAKDIFSHYEAGADHFLNLMFTFDRKQKLTGIVVNVPCPSQLSEHFVQFSSDFWEEVRQLVGQKYGSDVYVLPQCAAAGDLSPRILHYKQAQARRMTLKYGLAYDVQDNEAYNKIMAERRDIAERILQSIDEVYSWACKDIRTQLPVRHQKTVMPLNRRMITEEERMRCLSNIDQMDRTMPSADACTPEDYRKAYSNYELIRDRNVEALRRYDEQKTQPALDFIVHTVRIGEIAFASNPFELYMDFMHRIQARSPFIQTFVIQLAGDIYSGYLATERGAENKGYSASIYCNLVSPEGGQQLVDNTLAALEDLF